jgi:glycosyltransferase involved in cell wall biosynthesis
MQLVDDERVRVYTLKKRETAVEWEKAGVPVFEMGMGRWPTPGVLRRLRTKLAELSATVVHSLTLHSVLLSRLARRNTDAFRVVSAPCLNFRTMPSYVNWLVRGTANWDDAVVCESTATREFLVSTLAHDPQKAVYVPNSIDTHVFRFDQVSRDTLRSEWSVSPREILVGTVGRLHAQKGFDVFVRAFEALKNYPVKGLIIGEGKDAQRLQTLIDELGVPVSLVGKKDNMPAVLSALDVYVQSSRYEGMSRALMEAMAAGRPIVATAVDGTMDLAQDGKNMLLCRVDDPSSLTLGIATLIEKMDLRKQLSQQARITAEQFSVDKMVRRLEKIYQELK